MGGRLKRKAAAVCSGQEQNSLRKPLELGGLGFLQELFVLL